MFRKLLLASVAALGLLFPLAAATTANAHEFRHEAWHGRHHEHSCRVYYHDPCRPGWAFAGTFRGHREAERFAEQYRYRGFEVSIR